MHLIRATIATTLLLASPFSTLAEEQKNDSKPTRDFTADAQRYLDAKVQVKGRKKALTHWLTAVDAEKTDLGEYQYLTALVSAKLGQPEDAAKRLLATIRNGKLTALPYHVAQYQSLLTRTVQSAIQRAFEARQTDLIPALVNTLIAHTDRPPAAVITPLCRKLKTLEPAEASALRSALLEQITTWSFLSVAERDELAGLMYGRRIETVDSSAPTASATKPIVGTQFISPEFLIMGGGGSPSHNQISLEKNVQFLLRVQAANGLSTDKNHILFADGTNKGRDLQLVDEQHKPDELQEMLAGLLASRSGIRYTYRDNELENVEGESSEPNIKKYFEELSATNGQPVVVNFTGHGGRGDKKDTQNTCMYLWDSKSLRVKDFCKMLDEVPTNSPLMVLMVQCFSGGFANIIFEEGNPEKDLAKHLRCGFFATVHDRIAAGCTPAVNEADYREYSTYFLAALHGEDRVGHPIEKPDYDGDGKVCFAEAHAYALITSDTLDISVKTSDAFLRKFSKLGTGMMDTSSYYRLIEQAGPMEKAVLEQLAVKLHLHGDARVPSAIAWSKHLLAQRKKSETKRNEAKKTADSAKNELRKALREKWPELFYPWHPAISEIIANQSDEIRKVIETHPKGQEYKDALKTYSEHSEAYYKSEARWAVYQRFIRTAENVAYETNLAQVAKPEIVERFRQLQKLECGTLQSEKAQKRKAL